VTDRRYTVYVGFRVYEPAAGQSARGAKYCGSMKVHGWTLEEVRSIVERFKAEFEREAERERADRARDAKPLPDPADHEVR